MKDTLSKDDKSIRFVSNTYGQYNVTWGDPKVTDSHEHGRRKTQRKRFIILETAYIEHAARHTPVNE